MQVAFLVLFAVRVIWWPVEHVAARAIFTAVVAIWGWLLVRDLRR